MSAASLHCGGLSQCCMKGFVLPGARESPAPSSSCQLPKINSAAVQQLLRPSQNKIKQAGMVSCNAALLNPSSLVRSAIGLGGGVASIKFKVISQQHCFPMIFTLVVSIIPQSSLLQKTPAKLLEMLEKRTH